MLRAACCVLRYTLRVVPYLLLPAVFVFVSFCLHVSVFAVCGCCPCLVDSEGYSLRSMFLLLQMLLRLACCSLGILLLLMSRVDNALMAKRISGVGQGDILALTGTWGGRQQA